MAESHIIAVPAATALATAAAVPAVRRWARRSGRIDRPGPRRLHAAAVPRGAGLAACVVLVVAGLLAPLPIDERIGLALALAGCGWIGWADDGAPRPRWQRLLVHCLAAGVLLAAAGGLPAIEIGGRTLAAPVIWNALALVAVVWCLNLYNFMDGSNGLATMQAGVTAIGFAWFGSGDPATLWLAVALAGAAFGFLPWNFPRPRVFLGDAGSLTLGVAVAALSLHALRAGTVALPVALILSSVFAVDASATLLRRWWRGAQWWQPHREHAYQRLVTSAGWSHVAVWWLYLGLNLLVAWPAAWLASRYTSRDWLILVGLIAVLLAGWGACAAMRSPGHAHRGAGL